MLPIWVGIYEANAIALEIEKVTTPRPMTHDLLKNLLLGLETHVHKVVVSELRDDTFYALIWLERDGQMMSIFVAWRDPPDGRAQGRPSSGSEKAGYRGIVRGKSGVWCPEGSCGSCKRAGASRLRCMTASFRKSTWTPYRWAPSRAPCVVVVSCQALSCQ